MLGISLSAVYIALYTPQQPYEGRYYYYPFLQRGESKCLALGRLASKWQKWDLNIGSLAPGFVFLTLSYITILRLI